MLNPDYFSNVRGGRQAWIAGLCGDLARALDLPVGVVRIVVAVFAVLPTGLTYVALSTLANRRGARTAFSAHAGSFRAAAPPPNAGFRPDWMGPRQRFAELETRLNAMEAFVSSKDFELHKSFRQMRS